MKEKSFNLLLRLWVALGLGVAIFFGAYSYQKGQNYFSDSQKATAETMQGLSSPKYSHENEVNSFVRSMINDMTQHQWNLETWKKYSNPDLIKLLSEVKIAGTLFSYSGRISGVTTTSPIKILDTNIKNGKQHIKIQIDGNIGIVTMTLQKNKKDYKISNFKMKI